MKKVPVPFPLYLNAKKLFYKWEYDVILAAGATGSILFMIQLWFNLNILFAVAFSVAVSFFMMKNYVKFFKKTRKGFITHWFYSKGFVTPINSQKVDFEFEKDLIPPGFVTEFIN